MSKITLESVIISSNLDPIQINVGNKTISWEDVLLKSVKMNNQKTFELAIQRSTNILTETYIKWNNVYFADQLYIHHLPASYEWQTDVIRLGNVVIYEYLSNKYNTNSTSITLNAAIKFRRAEFIDIVERKYNSNKMFLWMDLY